jgi:endonuclease/exonuclease/phosphatase family metal-dependent hydrolase
VTARRRRALPFAVLLAAGCGSTTEEEPVSPEAGTGGSSGSAGAPALGGTSGAPASGGSAGSAGASAEAGSAGASARSALVAATVNARCLLDDWEKRKGPLADGIAAIDPDLLALQEVCRTASKDSLLELVDLVNQKTGRGYQSVRYDTHSNPLAGAEEGIAVVTPHAILSQKSVDLPAGVFKRAVIVTRIATQAGTLIFAGTHLDFLLGETRRAELSAARAAIEAERQPGEPALLAGDMNEEPDGAAIQEALGAGYVDLWALLRPGEPGLTSPADKPKNRIDYLLLSDPESRLAPRHAFVFLDQPVGGVWPSDHRGVWAGLEAPGG